MALTDEEQKKEFEYNRKIQNEAIKKLQDTEEHRIILLNENLKLKKFLGNFGLLKVYNQEKRYLEKIENLKQKIKEWEKAMEEVTEDYENKLKDKSEIGKKK